jgi:hypothetical protein
MMSLESDIEKAFVRWCRVNHVVSLKLNPNWYRSIPDRIVVLPHPYNASIFIEFKRPGGKFRRGQLKRLRYLRRLGYAAYMCDTLERAIGLVTEYRQEAA